MTHIHENIRKLRAIARAAEADQYDADKVLEQEADAGRVIYLPEGAPALGLQGPAWMRSLTADRAFLESENAKQEKLDISNDLRQRSWLGE